MGIVIIKNVQFCSDQAKPRRTELSLSWANPLKMSNIEHFPDDRTLQYVASEKQGAHSETDGVRAVPYLWCRGRGSL